MMIMIAVKRFSHWYHLIYGMKNYSFKCTQTSQIKEDFTQEFLWERNTKKWKFENVLFNDQIEHHIPIVYNNLFFVISSILDT